MDALGGTVTVKIKFDLSLWDAIKWRLAGKEVRDALIAMCNAEREDQLRDALLELRRDSDGLACWCEMAIGNPMVHDHSKGCQLARAALQATTDTVLLTPDEIQEIQEMHDDGRLSYTEGEDIIDPNRVGGA